MYIEDLYLKNFRNYDSLDVSFSGEYNVIYGANAQGKTNILEAVFLCATGRSHRTYRDSEMIRHAQDALKVALSVEKKNRGKIKIEVDINSAGKKSVRINELPIKRMGDLMGYLNVVIFTPEDVRITKEEPQVRRRVLDMFISQIKPAYFFNLQQYIKVLRQRNALLRQIKDNEKLLGTLDAWNEALVAPGVRIMKER